MLPIPTLPTMGETEVVLSTPSGPAKRTRGGRKKDKGKESEVTLAEPVTADEDSSPLAKKQKSGSGAV